MTAPLPDQLLEEEIRAMLQRRAQDVNPQLPSWRELAQRNGAVVISLRTGAPVTTDADRRRRRLSRQWFRPVLAAAVALIVAMVGAVLVQGSGPPGGDAADGPEPLDVPSAGQDAFDPTQATPLFPVTSDDASTDIPRDAYLSNATETAERFLANVGLPVDAGTGEVIVDNETRQSTDNGDEPPIQTATVAWSLRAEGMPDNPPLAEGTVWLRNPGRGGRDTWLVVGVSTLKLWLTDIRRDGDRLSFTVDRSTDVETYPEAQVTVNNEPVGSVEVGEAVPFDMAYPSGVVAIIRVQHVEAGLPMSITSTAVPADPNGSLQLPDAPPPTTSASTTPGVRIGGNTVLDEVPAVTMPTTVPVLPGGVMVVIPDPTAALAERRGLSRR
jgi:hypothetical protein